MEEAWRYRPIQGANICPTCSIPHFPFCPQPPPLHRNLPPDHLHRLPFDHNPPPSHGPFFKQEPDNYPMPIPGTGPSPYSRPNPNPIPGNSFGLPDFSPSWSGGFFREELDERAYKKTRIGEMGSDSFPQMIPPGHSDYVSAERERRLSLIREHGGQQSIPPQDSPFGSGPILASNMRSGQSFEYDYRSDRYLQGRSTQENRLEDKRMTGGDSQGYMISDNFNPSVFDSAARARPTSNHPVHIDARDNYRDHFRSFPRSDNFQDDTLRGHGPGFDHQRNSNGFQSNVECTPWNREESSAGTLYDSQDKKHPHAHNAQPDILSHALPSLGPRNVSMGVLNLVEPVRGSKEPQTRYGEEDYDLRQKTNWVGGSFLISEQGNQNQSDHFPQASHENIEAYDHQRLLAREYSSGTPGNQPQNTYTATRQATNAQQQERCSYMPTESCLPHPLLPQQLHTMHGSVGNMQEFSARQVPMREEFQRAAETRTVPPIEQSDTLRIKKHRGYSTMPASRKMNFDTSSIGAMHPSPPLPQQHRPKDPPAPYPSNYQVPPSPPRTSSPLCPITTSSSAPMALLRPSAIHHLPEFQPPAQAHVYSKPPAHASNGFPPEASQFIHKALSNQYVEEGQPFLRKNSQPDKPKVIDAAHLFRQPHRGTRPDHIVIILRGLPGSGKSYLAKVLRDLEVENGGNAPRIHSMDDYFMAEVEKVEEVDNSKPSSLVKGKKRITKKVMEYCYEPEMEETYRSSMLKAFKKTLEEGAFTFIIVDDRNLRVADFAQFWATAKRSGYEVYLLEASYKDPVGCAARNVHGFTADEIRKMAEQWEQAPPMYLQLDAQSFFRGDDLNDCGIQEVDMDMDDVSVDGSISDITDKNLNKSKETSLADNAPDDSLKPGEQWATERDESVEAVKELGRSKWSEDLDDDVDRTEGAKGNLSALSGLIKAYGKGQKSVRWGDEVGKSGFWIGAAKKSNMPSLSIGPGAGYNLDSNPLLEEDNVDAIESNIGESKRRTTFLEQLRAERESFRAVFDRRRQRISGLETDDE